MKIKLLLLTAILSTSAVKAQNEFAPLGATWYYGITEAMWGDEGYLKVTAADTSVIDGKKVKVLTAEYHASDGGVYPRDAIYIHQTGDSVLFYRDGGFHLVYNFGLNVGDTMELYNPDNKDCNYTTEDLTHGHVVLESIKTLNINGFQLKEFNFASADPRSGHSRFSDYYHYIEKIGTTSNLFGEDCIADNFGAGIFGSFRCYEDSEIGHYQHGKVACDSLYLYDWTEYHRWEDSMLRIDIIDKEDLGLKFSYSQSEKAIVIDTYDSCEPNVVKVFDVDGRLIFSDVCEPNNQARVALKRNGIYIILINNNIGTFREKIIAY